MVSKVHVWLGIKHVDDEAFNHYFKLDNEIVDLI